MDDKSSPTRQDQLRLEKSRSSQNDLLVKIKHRQDSEKLLHTLVLKLSALVKTSDPVLINNLQILYKALQQGENILQLNPLVKDILDRIQPQLDNVVISKSSKRDAAEVKQQIYLIQDVLLVLLENINFPPLFSQDINKIKKILRSATDDNIGLLVLAGVTALAEVLDDIFYSVNSDKEKVTLFINKVNIDLQNMDEDIAETNSLQAAKKKTEYEINCQLETHMQEMEDAVSEPGGIDQIKTYVQGTVKTIRNQMEDFKQRSTEYDQQASVVVDRLRNQLHNMEAQYADLKKQVLEKNEPGLSDPVTGVRNRLAYEEAIYLEVERYKRYGRPFTLVMFDLDKFKDVNDTFGKDFGDNALKDVARIIASNIRSVDFLARYDEDKFVIILPELGKEDGKRLADKVCKGVQEKSFDFGGKSCRITVSGGIATVKLDDSIETLFDRVDLALYLAKEKGRNRYEVD